jgi:hypothetical protein
MTGRGCLKFLGLKGVGINKACVDKILFKLKQFVMGKVNPHVNSKSRVLELMVLYFIHSAVRMTLICDIRAGYFAGRIL